ncbi:hypothetical protein BSKO_09333 [Bryopsis sp. KO-2023]|nr:hypothetical protein BSKO_09333 [Bryopsis sp. KO-2023]
MSWVVWGRTLVVLLLLGFGVLGSGDAPNLDNTQQAAVSQFFGSLDGNSDGQIDETEARKYIGESIGGSEFDTRQKVDAALDQMTTNVDGTDPLTTISVAELQNHLKDLLRGSSVGEWVRHGLGLPQFEEAFKKNAITVLDFPLLMEDEEILKNDLQVTSRLHRAQIKRGLQLLILGLGEPPSRPKNFRCGEVDCNLASLSWSQPAAPDNPPVHKFVIERRSAAPGGHAWKEVHEQEVSDSNEYFVSIPHAEDGRHEYRIAAWSVYGRSKKASSGICETALKNGQICAQPASFRAGGGPNDLVSSVGIMGMSAVHQTSDGPKRAVLREGLFAGASTLFVLLLTVAVRFLHSRHISLVRCLAFLGLSRVARALHLAKLESWLEGSRRSNCRAGSEETTSHNDVVEGQSHPKRNHSKGAMSKSGSQGFSNSGLDSSRDFGSSQWGTDENGQDGGYPEQGVWGDDRMEKVADHFPANAWDSVEDSVDIADEDGTDLPQYEHSELIVGQCSFALCRVHWRGFRRWRKRAIRHFCGICQLPYCADHTPIVTHSSLASCGQQSQCVCQNCFEKLSSERQKQLERTTTSNRNLRRQSDVGAAAGGEGEASHVGKWSIGKRLSRQKRSVGSASSSSIPGPDWSDSSGRFERNRARSNWSRAGCKVRAVCSLKLAGKEMERRRSASNPPL